MYTNGKITEFTTILLSYNWTLLLIYTHYSTNVENTVHSKAASWTAGMYGSYEIPVLLILHLLSET